MTPNRIMPAAAVRRALLLALATVACAVAFVACGGRGDTSSAAAEKEADAVVLNEILARQSAAVAAYDHVLPGLGGAALATARRFRVQEQEHIDAVLQRLRALGEASEPPAESIDSSGLRSEAEYLNFLYELESATIAAELTAIARLTSPAAEEIATRAIASTIQTAMTG
jgi:hypothetical protein